MRGQWLEKPEAYLRWLSSPPCQEKRAVSYIQEVGHPTGEVACFIVPTVPKEVALGLQENLLTRLSDDGPGGKWHSVPTPDTHQGKQPGVLPLGTSLLGPRPLQAL